MRTSVTLVPADLCPILDSSLWAFMAKALLGVERDDAVRLPAGVCFLKRNPGRGEDAGTYQAI
jgi:hypothetical protein